MKGQIIKGKKLAKTIKLVTGKMATIACGSVSIWGGYQMKEPKVVKEMIKK